MKKRILSILLTLVMVIGMLPTVAYAVTSGSGTEHFVLDAFRDGKNYAGTATGIVDDGTQAVDLAKLIIYERWSKQ